MMNRENAAEGAATPETAQEQIQANSTRFFNRDTSIENDNLKIEYEQLIEEKEHLTEWIKALEAAAALEFTQLARMLFLVADELNNFSTMQWNNWEAYQQRLSELNSGKESQEVIYGLDYVIDTTRRGNLEIIKYLSSKAEELNGKLLADSNEVVNIKNDSNGGHQHE